MQGIKYGNGIHEVFHDDQPEYFTFLRSPVSRVISDYYKILRTPSNEFHEMLNSVSATLEDFVRQKMSPFIANHMTVFLGRDSVDDNHNADQCTPGKTELTEKCIDRLNKFFFVGLQESYARDLAWLSDKMGFPLKEFHENKADRTDDHLQEHCA